MTDKDEVERLKQACDGYLGHAAGLRDEVGRLNERIRFADQEFAAECAALRAENERLAKELSATVAERTRAQQACEQISAENERLTGAIERISKASNTDPFRTFDGMIQDMQMIDDIARSAFSTPQSPSLPKFAETFCSQCGGAFGPGDSGYSHCDQHLGGDPYANEARRWGYEQGYKAGAKDMHELRAENERLREALERIKEQPNKSSCIAVARAALQSKGE
jgi:regulator of replication initiation timing